MPVIPKQASTVILLREGPSAGPEVFLIKRHEKNPFMGGMTVYPGGRVEEADRSPDLLPFAGTGPGGTDPVPGLGTDAVRSFKIGAVRELFEEAGVLFVSHGTGGLLSLEDPVTRNRYGRYRAALSDRTLTLSAILGPEGGLLALDELVFAGRWLTPEARSMRFDTLFFAARLPAGQEPAVDAKEATEGLWIEPDKALRMNLEGALVLSPPTLMTLEDLSRFRSVDEALDSVGHIYPDPVLPILLFLPHGELILFPWDGDYDRARAGEPPKTLAPSRPASPGERTSRLLLQGNRYLPCVRDGNP